MPRIKTDYSKTVIYKIVCNNLEVKDLYVGSTSNFRIRKNCHKTVCSNEKDRHHNHKVYQSIRANGGWENWSMIEIEKYPCKDKNEAHTRERFWYEELDAKLNVKCPTLNLEKQKEYIKKFNETDERKEYMKKYNAEHREELYEKRKDYLKIYKAEHREKANQQQRERRAKKRESKTK